MRSSSLLCVMALTLAVAPLLAQSSSSSSEQLQVGPPPIRRAEPPTQSASIEDLESRGDALKGEKAYLDALDYYRAALGKHPTNPSHLYNKAGITELLLTRLRDARKDFEKSIKYDRRFADAYNNLGVIHYMEKRYGKAISQYNKAIELRPDGASYYSNLGTAYFSRKDFDKASAAYTQAVQLDPEIFARTSHNGIAAQMSSPEDRARFNYMLAKLFAKSGRLDDSLQFLRHAMEDGYPQIEDVFKDEDFATLRKDPRFDQLMHQRPPAITQ